MDAQPEDSRRNIPEEIEALEKLNEQDAHQESTSSDPPVSDPDNSATFHYDRTTPDDNDMRTDPSSEDRVPTEDFADDSSSDVSPFESESTPEDEFSYPMQLFPPEEEGDPAFDASHLVSAAQSGLETLATLPLKMVEAGLGFSALTLTTGSALVPLIDIPLAGAFLRDADADTLAESVKEQRLLDAHTYAGMADDARIEYLCQLLKKALDDHALLRRDMRRFLQKIEALRMLQEQGKSRMDEAFQAFLKDLEREMTIHTGGGAYIAGDVHIGGDFIARDQFRFA